MKQNKNFVKKFLLKKNAFFLYYLILRIILHIK